MDILNQETKTVEGTEPENAPNTPEKEDSVPQEAADVVVDKEAE